MDSIQVIGNTTMEMMEFTETMTTLIVWVVVIGIVLVILGSIFRAFSRSGFMDKREDDEDDDEDDYKYKPEEELYKKKVKPIDPKEFE